MTPPDGSGEAYGYLDTLKSCLRLSFEIDKPMDVIEQMRMDWNRRAREDPNYYVAFAPMNDEEFLQTGAFAASGFEAELHRLPRASGKTRALEIGCGPGRLLIPMSR